MKKKHTQIPFAPSWRSALKGPREEVVRRSSKAGDEYTTVVFPLQIEAGSIESWGYLACDDERTEEGPIEVGMTQEGQLEQLWRLIIFTSRNQEKYLARVTP